MVRTYKHKTAVSYTPDAIEAIYQRRMRTCHYLHCPAGGGISPNKGYVTAAVCQYLTENPIPSPFKNGFPGESWWRGFLKRWPILSEQKPEHLTSKRAKSLTSKTIQEWTKKLSQVYDSADL
jgi:hypothetical protein